MVREYTEIIPIYEQRWAARPESYYFLPLANAYRAVGQPQQAIEILKQGLERHPDHLSGRAALAVAYFNAEFHEESEAEAQKVLAAQPDNLLARRLLVECHRETGRVEEALAEIKHLLELSPEDERLQGTLQALEGYLAKEAAEVLAAEEPPAEAAVPPHPESPLEPQPTETLAELYSEQGLVEEAIAVFRSLLDLEPDNERYLQRLAALEDKLAESCHLEAEPEPSGQPSQEEELPEAALGSLLDDTAAVEEIRSLFPSQPPPEEDRDAQTIAVLEGWLASLEQRRGSPPTGR